MQPTTQVVGETWEDVQAPKERKKLKESATETPTLAAKSAARMGHPPPGTGMLLYAADTSNTRGGGRVAHRSSYGFLLALLVLRVPHPFAFCAKGWVARTSITKS